MWNCSQEILVPPFIADPTGNADVQAQAQIVFKFLRATGKAVRHTSYVGGPMILKNRQEVLVSGTLVEKQGLSVLRC